jgi:hypothetical protein
VCFWPDRRKKDQIGPFCSEETEDLPLGMTPRDSDIILASRIVVDREAKE